MSVVTRWASTLCAGVLAAAMLVPNALAQQQQQKFKMRVQAGVPAASLYFELTKKLGQRVERMSGGRLQIEVLPDGAVVPVYEILDAVDKGIVDAGYSWTHFWSGKHPAAGLFSNPMAGAGFGLDQLSHMAWFYEGGGEKLYRKLYAEVLKMNIEPMLVQPMGPDPLGWFRRPIKDASDFKKLKYRAPPGIAGEIFKEMGISATALPGGEIVTAAQRGVIDAAEWIGPADDMNLGLYTIWKHYYLQGLHQSTDVAELIINKTFWDKLPPDLQEIVRGAAMANVAETYVANVWRNASALEKLKSQHQVTVHDTPRDFYPEFLRATNTVLQRYAAKDAFFKEVLESQRQFAKTVVPYWTKINQLYTEMGTAALKPPAK